MKFEEHDLDLILVPAGLLIMFTYNLYLLYRVLRYPQTTAIGYENHNWMVWVEIMMKDDDVGHMNLSLTVIMSNTSASTFLASVCLTLSSFIGAWVGTSPSNPVQRSFILGDTNSVTISIKNISTLFAFILAFGSFIQSARYYVQANSLVSMPITDVPAKYGQMALLWANNFWQVGLRLLYLAMSLLLWSFGPIPMFASCVVIVIFLSFLDFNTGPLVWYPPVARPSQVKKMMEEVAASVRAAEHLAEKVAAAVSAVEHRVEKVAVEVASTGLVTEHHRD